MKLSDLFFDRRCGICGEKIYEGAVCGKCEKEIASHINVRIRRIYVGTKGYEVRYLFDYGVPIVKDLLFRLKRLSNKDLFKYAAELYALALPENFEGVVTNCPRRGVGKRKYGYDQVEAPCRIMCKGRKGLKYKHLVNRHGLSKEQKMLSQNERAENVKDKFRVIKKDIPKNILICDDVITTGSTVGECISALQKTGNNVSVTVVCLASRNIFPREG